jgi:hypothetical protein
VGVNSVVVAVTNRGGVVNVKGAKRLLVLEVMLREGSREVDEVVVLVLEGVKEVVSRRVVVVVVVVVGAGRHSAFGPTTQALFLQLQTTFIPLKV